MEFEQFKIKEYDLWTLFLHQNQFPYVGRCYAWANRSDANLITDINFKETVELFGIIIPGWNKVIKELFDHDRPNLAILGNEAPHLHAHLIPRYNTPREVYGINFVDPNPTGNYAPYKKQKMSLEILLMIKEDIKNKI